MAVETESNPILDFAINYDFPAYETEKGIKKVVAFGENSHKCPVYVWRTPPCSAGCPAEEDIRGYHNILREVEKTDNKWEAAWRRVVEKNPFPSVMGRVCPAPCESKCNRQYHDETVGINAVEQAIGEYAIANNLQFNKPTTKTDKKIAVVGSGPAGLSCAYQLALKGHQVTLFEASDKPGGMMRYGIMGYRVDRKVLDAEIERIMNLGIEFKPNTHIGKDITLDQLQKDYAAVFVGIGAQKGRNLPIPGAEGTENVLNAIEFLQDFEKRGAGVKVGNKVLVIGDGDVSMDVARLALRLGSKEVSLVSAVAREDMACSKPEFDEAESEGTGFHYKLGSQEVIVKGGKAAGLKVVEMQKKEKGEEGWNSPVPFLRYKPIPGTEKVIEADMIVSSIGQGLDLTGLENLGNGKPWLQVDRNYQVKDMPGVFSGGDALSLTLLTTAIGHGRKAAESIEYYINGKDFPMPERPDVIKYDQLANYYFEKDENFKRSHKKADPVQGHFEELLVPLDQETAIKESERCMSCGLCFECNQCLLFCPQEAIVKFKKNPVGEVMFTEYEKCVGCHICSEVCPTGYIDMGMGHGL